MKTKTLNYHPYDFYIFALFYISASCIPFSLFVNNLLLVIGLQIIVQAIFLVVLFIYFYLHKLSIFKNDKPFNLKALLFLLPCFVICFSNYFVLLSGFSFTNAVNLNQMGLLILLNAFVITNEELIFRFFALDLFKDKNKWFRLIIPAILFALAHLSRYFSTFNPFDLISVAYAFGLGLVLNIMYMFTNTLIPGAILHLMFNIFNDVIFATFFVYESTTYFILINVGVALFVVIYLLILYLVKRKQLTIK